MKTDVINIQSGAVVRDAQGKEIGRVARIWPHIPASYAEGPPTPGQPLPHPSDVGYFSLDCADLLSPNVKHLYVPFKAVREFGSDGSLTLDCRDQACAEEYSWEPWFLDRDAG